MKLSVLNLLYVIKKQWRAIKLSFLIVFMLLITSSCEKEDDTTKAFKSDFYNTTTSSIDKSKYWSKTPQDWQISNNRLECLVSNKSRKIHLLTRQLGTQEGNLEMKVRLGFYNNKISSSNNNWAGFKVGSKERFLDFSKRTNYQNGIDIGVCTNGALFIGAPSPNHNNKKIIEALKTGVDLKIVISNNRNGYTIDFSVLEIERGKVLGHISKKNISSEKFIGDLVLASSIETLNLDNGSTIKSVWFQKWEIKGAKVINRDARSFDAKSLSK